MFLEDGPDISFDDLYNLHREIARLEHLVFTQESIIDAARASYKKICIENKEFWPHKKPPSMEYLKQVVHYVGNSEQDHSYLVSMETDLAQYKKEFAEAKGLLDKMHWKLRTWQTQSANMRKTIVE